MAIRAFRTRDARSATAARDFVDLKGGRVCTSGQVDGSLKLKIHDTQEARINLTAKQSASVEHVSGR